MITEKILKELGFERHPALKSSEFWDLWLSDNTYNEKEHKFNRVLYIKVDFMILIILGMLVEITILKMAVVMLD